MSQDTRILIYLSIMALVLSCAAIIYGFIFVGDGVSPLPGKIEVSPFIIIVIGIVLSFINGISTNILSDQISAKLNLLPRYLRLGLPVTVAILTLALSFIIAVMSI